jgi:transcriptional regulator with XRE-family HTH domain
MIQVRLRRIAKHWKASDLAREAGISEATVLYIESGKKQPTMRTLAKVAAALGVTVRELMAEVSHIPTPDKPGDINAVAKA